MTSYTIIRSIYVITQRENFRLSDKAVMWSFGGANANSTDAVQDVETMTRWSENQGLNPKLSPQHTPMYWGMESPTGRKMRQINFIFFFAKKGLWMPKASWYQVMEAKKFTLHKKVSDRVFKRNIKSTIKFQVLRKTYEN